jgi:hypothetical protein
MSNPRQLQSMITWAASQYGYDPGVLIEVARLESGFRPGAVNDWDINAKNGTPSKGLMQFIEPTFKAYARQARDANPRAWQGVNMDWLDPKAQALAAAWAMKNGKGSAWATYQKALKKRGAGGVSGGPGLGLTAPLEGGVSDETEARLARLREVRARLAAPEPVEAAAPKEDPLKSRLSSVRSARSAYEKAIAPKEEPAGQSFGGGAGDDFQLQNGGKQTYKDLLALGQRFGLRIDGSNQTTGGSHADGSLHYAGRAVDFGDAKNSRAQLRALAAWARRNAHRVKEFYYDPLGWYIKDGKVIKGAIGGHGDHVHIAM